MSTEKPVSARQRATPRTSRSAAHEVRQDVVYAIRQLVRTPAFAIIAVLTLALGIGATTAIFSAVWSVVLRPFPFAHPERVVRVTARWQGSEGDVSDGNFVDWYARQTAFERLAAEQFTGFTLADRSSTDRVTGALVTKDFFEVFGIRPAFSSSSIIDSMSASSKNTVVPASRNSASPAA